MTTASTKSNSDKELDELDHQVKDLQREKEDLLNTEYYLRCVNEFATDLLNAETINDVLWIITSYIIEKFGFEDCVVYLLDEETNSMQKVASHSVWGTDERIVKNYIAIPVGEGIVGTVAKTGKPEIINDTHKDPRYIVDDANRQSELTVPIIRNGKVIGIIDSENESKNYFNEGHLETLIAISNLAAIKIDNLYASERELKHSQALERINSELERFVYHVTHDLKSPLANLQGMMGLLEGEKDTTTLSQMYASMNNSIGQMAEFIDEILTYSRNANSAVSREKVELHPFLHQVIEAHRYQENAEKIDFRLETNGLAIETDINRLRVIFNNLISNAIKYHDLQKKELFISVSAMEVADGVEVSVEDNGLGMTKTEQSKVFDMFYRVPRHQTKTAGTGVGLYILNETVNKLGGAISLDSKKGKGSVFTVSIPHDISSDN